MTADLTGSVALVTGGNNGIGRATAAITFFATDDAAYVRGAILPVDGGRTAV